MHDGSVVSLQLEGRWPPKGEHFCFEVELFDFSRFFSAREKFNIFYRTGTFLTTFPGKDKVIALVTDEKIIPDLT